MWSKYLKRVGCLGLIASLSGCATLWLSEQTENSVTKSYELKEVFQDAIVSYGVPSVAIPQYEYAIALAGQQYSYLVKPSGKDGKPHTLFRDFMTHIDLKHLAFTTGGEIKLHAEKNLSSIRDMQFLMDNNKVKTHAVYFIFLKPKALLTPNEQQQLEQYAFICEDTQLGAEKKDFIFCKQKVSIDVLVTQKAQNTDQLTHQFREPLKLRFYQNQATKDIHAGKMALKSLYPLAVAYDIVTAPITLGAAYIYFDIMDKPFLKF